MESGSSGSNAPSPFPSSKGGEKGWGIFLRYDVREKYRQAFDMYLKRLAFAEAERTMSTAIGNVEGNIG